MRILGFLVGFLAALGLEVLLLSAIGAHPRGGGWVFLPIMAGVSLSRAAPQVLARLGNGEIKQAFFGLQRQTRALLVGCLLWLVAVPMYVFLFDPFDGYIGSEDYDRILKVMLFPVGLAVAGYFAYIRLVVAEQVDVSPIKQSEAEPSQNILTSADPAPALQAENLVDVDEPEEGLTTRCISAIKYGRADFWTYDRLIRACGGRIEARGFLFTAHYLICLGQKTWTIKRFEELRPWFLSNLIPRLQIEQQD